MLRIAANCLVQDSQSCRGPAAQAGRRRRGDFVLRTPGVSPLDHAKGRRALDPAKNAGAFFRNRKNNLFCKL